MENAGKSAFTKIEKTIIPSLKEFNKKILKPEKKVVKLNRRGIYAKRKIIKGEKISSVNSAFLRPSNTNDFLYIKKIIDKKIKHPKKQNQRIC